MKFIYTHLFSICIISFILYSCTSTKPEAISREYIPKDRKNYWYAEVELIKPFPKEYREVARLKVQEQIASQIEVSVVSSLERVLRKSEEGVVSDFGEKITISRVSAVLPLLEYDEFSTDTSFYYYANLKKQDYYNSIGKKTKNALAASVGYIQRSEKRFSGRSFSLLGDAWNEVADYLDQPLEVTYPPNSSFKENLYSLIKMNFVDAYDRVEIVPAKDDVTLKAFLAQEEPFKIICLDKNNGDAVTNLPITANLGFNSTLVKSVTDSKGIATFGLSRIKEGDKNQKIHFMIDLEELVDSTALSMLMEKQSGTAIKLNVSGPNIHIKATENVFGEKIEKPIITPALKEYFSKQFSARFTDQNSSDLVVELAVNIEKQSKKKNEYGLYVAYASMTLSVYENSLKKEIYSAAVTDVQGAHFGSINQAGNKALNNLAKELQEKTLKNMVEDLEG